MVNDRVVSRFTGTPDRKAGGIIGDKPLYSPAEVLELLETRGVDAIRLWTTKCQKDVQDLELDLADVMDLIKLALRQGRFLNAQWCLQKPDGPWAACDAYVVTRSEWIEAASRSMEIEYYLKFALNRSGKLLMLVSCHTSY